MDRFIRCRCEVLLGIALSGLCGATSVEADEPRPRTVFNDDAQMLMETPDAGATAFVESWLDREAAAVPFSTYVFLSATPDICTYQSRAGETYGARFGPEFDKGWAPGVRALKREQTDALRVVTRHMHALGKEVLAAIRMSDTHHRSLDPHEPLCPQFAIDHPEYVIRQPDGRTNETALDYSHAEVREHRLRIMQEIVDNYDVDGLELNFVRWAKHFPRDQGREKAAIMTDYVRQIRQLLDQAAGRRRQAAGGQWPGADELKRRGQERLTLGVRVPESLAACWLAGVDVETWVKEGWLDYVVISTWNNTDPQLRVDEFARFTKPAGVDTIVVMGNMIGSIYSGLPDILDRPVAMSAKHRTQSYLGMLLTAPEARAAAANYYTWGADSISFWNVGIHYGSESTATPEQQERMARWTQAVRSPETVFAGPRTYRYLPMGKGMASRRPPARNYPWYDEGRSPLGHVNSPVLTFPAGSAGQRQSFPFRMADGRNGEPLEGLLTFWVYYLDEGDALEVDLNGRPISSDVIDRVPVGKRRGGLPGVRFEIPLAQCPPFRGQNELGLRLPKPSGSALAPYMEELEVAVTGTPRTVRVEPSADRDRRASVRLHLRVSTPLPYRNTPIDPRIDFPAFIEQAGVSGVLDPNSIEVRNLATGRLVPHARTEDFAYSDAGRVEFVIGDPQHTSYEIRFETTTTRPPLQPQARVPAVGLGDLLRYNAGNAAPVAVPYSAGLDDLNGDGQLDLTGTWNYAYRPGWPYDGVICYPHVGPEPLEFGDLTRVRVVDEPGAEPGFLSHIYMGVDFADFNGDGRVDMVVTRRGSGKATIYENTGTTDPGGLPRFRPWQTVVVPGWEACQAVDLDGDGAVDLIVDGQFVRNTSTDGRSFVAADPVALDAGRHPCFVDVDGDGRRDAVCLIGGDSVQPDFYRLGWRRNLGSTPLRFAAEQQLAGLDLRQISGVSAWEHGSRSGVIVQHRAFQELSVFALTDAANSSANESATQRALIHLGRAASPSAVISLSDQAWPCLTDWDADGDPDLLVGGGYGWPRILMNHGSATEPRFGEPRRLQVAGKELRLVRNELLGDPPNWHDMGYSYPVFADWDGDGLRDLLCPNETNRIFWYRNVGTASAPRFAAREQILCEGYPDSAELRSRSNRRAGDPQSNNGVYPLEPERPFMWRTGAAFADFTGDGLLDLVTLDGHTRVATLFYQQVEEDGRRGLIKGQVLTLTDGRPINDAIVDRRSHWTESFRAVDWDGDGLQDLMYSVAGAHGGTLDGGSIYWLRNAGTVSTPVFAPPQTMRCFGEPIRITNHGPHPWAGDLNGDGLPDLLACVEWSVYPYYSHAALQMAARPEWTIELMPESRSNSSTSRSLQTAP